LEGAISTMPPMLRLEHYPVTIVRPLCLVNDSLIAQWAELFPVRRQKASCPYETASLRSDYVRLFREMEGLNPEVRFNLWKSMENIKSDMLPQKLCRNSLKSNKNGAVNKEK
ncbi:MAG: tRNA 2-thiocytidine(32) synthetase TtcA, partial [Paludibacteraceae bacterium]|nr:tRNA 2-thiocytidine(32) synthetase TtcA [Paludibacteraceae bacterium]